MTLLNRKNGKLNIGEIVAQADQTIKNTPNAEHVLYAANTLSNMYCNELAGYEPLDLSDITTPWQSIDEAMSKFSIFPMEDLELWAEIDSWIREDRPYKIRTKPDSYISAVVSKYFKTKGKQRDCIVVLHAMINKLIELCRSTNTRMPKSKVMEGAWKVDWEPSKLKFDAETGKALVIEGFEHLFKLYSKLTHYLYELYFKEKMTNRRKRSTKSKKQTTKSTVVAI